MKYKYLKGSEQDFDGAPNWATVLTLINNSYCWDEHEEPLIGVSRYQDFDNLCGVQVYGLDTITGGKIIAHREPITDEDDLNECINSTEALIAERGTRYGKFKDGAEIMQSLKDTMRDVDGWNNLTASQKEALDMIQHKIGRILNGDPTYDDSWKDIAGYATLIINELNGEVK